MDEYDDFDELSGYGEEIVETGWDEDELSGDDYDDMGYDDQVGDEVETLLEALSGYVGARRRPRRGRRKPKRKPKWTQTMRKIRPSQARRYPLGLGTTALLANATAVITVFPQLPFKLMRLNTPSTNVQVDNIQIGTVSQFVAAGGIPAEVFAPNAIGVNLKGDTAVPGVQIQITVTDTSGAPNTFTGALFGLVAQ